MLTIKICTGYSELGGWTKNIQIIEPSGNEVYLRKLEYKTSKEYQAWRMELGRYKIPIMVFGEEPKDNELESERVFLYGTYLDNSYEGCNTKAFLINNGQLYVMQNGKTIESIYIDRQNSLVEAE
uniref:Uncharacterized protein n=1 Tax=viral metagenome TaxID=1070528 RepID=A0A6M3KBK1_9ZZZZ